MVPTITKCILLIILSSFMKTQILIQGQQQVPCVFFYGDSQFDHGNNNMLITLAKSNYRPYGIDFPDGPTGRFSNGQTIVDFLTQRLGFANPISPFVTAQGSDVLRGVNYASGGAGIIDTTSFQMGHRFTMNRQLVNHRVTIGGIALLFRYNQTAVNDYLNRCLYVVNVGSNDYLNNYYIYGRLSPAIDLYTPDMFAENLIQRFSQQLRTLYNSGARKVAVFGLGLLGCVPKALANFPTNQSPCVDSVNNAVQLFNNRLPPLIDTMNTYSGAQFTLINVTNIALGDPSLIGKQIRFMIAKYVTVVQLIIRIANLFLGVRVTNASCCPAIGITGLCDPNEVPCSNRNEYIFWDDFHPTEIANRPTASRAYNALLPADAYPLDIRRLIQQ